MHSGMLHSLHRSDSRRFAPPFLLPSPPALTGFAARSKEIRVVGRVRKEDRERKLPERERCRSFGSGGNFRS